MYYLQLNWNGVDFSETQRGAHTRNAISVCHLVHHLQSALAYLGLLWKAFSFENKRE